MAGLARFNGLSKGVSMHNIPWVQGTTFSVTFPPFPFFCFLIPHSVRRCYIHASEHAWEETVCAILGAKWVMTAQSGDGLGWWVGHHSEEHFSAWPMGEVFVREYNIVGDWRNSHRPWTICLPYGCYLLIFLAQEMICQVHSNVDDGAMGGTGGKQSLKLVCMFGYASMFGDIVFP